jgi:four helix bundle protein
MQSYRELRVYKLADEITEQLFALTRALPQSELYSLTDQINRATQSVLANIAEGYGRRYYQQEYARFLTFSRASCHELREHLKIASLRGYCSRETYLYLDDKLDHLGKMLTLLIRKIRLDDSAT